MKKLSPRHIVVAAALFGLAAESAWSEEAASDTPPAPAEQTAVPAAGDQPGYAPAPYPRAYEPSRQPPPWPEPPPGYYGQFQPYYPPHPQYRSAPAAQRENPLSAELKQTQAQLAAKNTELNTALEQLATLQAEQQAIREVMQQAQAETAKASEQLSIVVEEMDILYEVLSELKARLDVQNTSLQGAVQAGAEENDQGGSAVKSDAEPVQSPAGTPVQPDNAVGEHTQVRDNEPRKPEAE